jgi:hypothetical protein
MKKLAKINWVLIVVSTACLHSCLAKDTNPINTSGTHINPEDAKRLAPISKGGNNPLEQDIKYGEHKCQ